MVRICLPVSMLFSWDFVIFIFRVFMGFHDSCFHGISQKPKDFLHRNYV